MVVSKKKKKLIPGFFSAAEKTVRVKATLMPERYFKKKKKQVIHAFHVTSGSQRPEGLWLVLCGGLMSEHRTHPRGKKYKSLGARI